MSWKLACGAAGALLIATVAAQASDATTLAARAGFLLGSGYRCGVEDGRLLRVETLVNELIAAVSSDGEDRAAAQARFAEQILASAVADLLHDPVPPCAGIRSALAQFEQHRQAVLHPDNRREGQMARDNRSGTSPAQPIRSAQEKPAKVAKPASTRREDLTPEQRAAFGLQRTARRDRGRPPSI